MTFGIKFSLATFMRLSLSRKEGRLALQQHLPVIREIGFCFRKLLLYS
jgi:hypothetical protein